MHKQSCIKHLCYFNLFFKANYCFMSKGCCFCKRKKKGVFGNSTTCTLEQLGPCFVSRCELIMSPLLQHRVHRSHWAFIVPPPPPHTPPPLQLNNIVTWACSGRPNVSRKPFAAVLHFPHTGHRGSTVAVRPFKQCWCDGLQAESHADARVFEETDPNLCTVMH